MRWAREQYTSGLFSPQKPALVAFLKCLDSKHATLNMAANYWVKVLRLVKNSTPSLRHLDSLQSTHNPEKCSLILKGQICCRKMVSIAIETLGIMSCDQRLCRRTSSMCMCVDKYCRSFKVKIHKLMFHTKLLLDCSDAAKIVNAFIASCTGEMYPALNLLGCESSYL